MLIRAAGEQKFLDALKVTRSFSGGDPCGPTIYGPPGCTPVTFSAIWPLRKGGRGAQAANARSGAERLDPRAGLNATMDLFSYVARFFIFLAKVIPVGFMFAISVRK